MDKHLKYVITSLVLFSCSAFSSEPKTALTVHLTSSNEAGTCDFFHKTELQRKLMMGSITMRKQEEDRYHCIAQLPEEKFQYCMLTGIDFTKGQGVCTATPKDKRVILDISSLDGPINCSFTCL